jgi:citrate lyase subunit beta/citryl-CoA lyase
MTPREALFDAEDRAPALPVCDHYSGVEARMRKSLELQGELGPVFDATLDCEDGAPVGGEAEHAHLCAELVMSAANRFGRVGARVHPVDHPAFEADVDTLIRRAGSRLAYLMVPKPRSAAEVARACDAIDHATRVHASGRAIPVHVLIETHGALREAYAIASVPGVECIDFGLMDFVSAHHGAIPASAMSSPGQFEHPLVVRAKCEIVAAALAAGVVPAHNVTTELHDTVAIAADARRAREQFGFLRMWSIHPDQIAPIVEAMRPDFGETQEAAEILLAARDADWGPIRQHGRLHDRASYRYFWELLRRAHATGMAVPPAAREAFFASDPR